MKYTAIIVLIALLSIVKLTESRASSSLQTSEVHGASSRDIETGVTFIRTLQTNTTEEAGEEEHHEEGEEEHHDEEDGDDHGAEDGHEDHNNGTETSEHHDEEDGEEHGDEDHHDDHEGHDHGTEDGDEAIASSSASDANDDVPWGPAIGAALIVNLATLVGVLFLVPAMLGGYSYSRASDDQGNKRLRYFLYTIIPSFAAGALLATTVFLLLPESVLLIGNATGLMEHNHRRHLEEDNAESQLAWKFGTALLGGFLIPIVMGSLFPHAHEDEAPKADCPVCEERNSAVVVGLEDVDKAVPLNTSGHASLSTCDEGGCNRESHAHEAEAEEEVWDGESCSTCNDENVPAAVAVQEQGTSVEDSTIEKPIQPKKKKQINYRLATSLFVGDFFHNFADGIFIGTAFKLCDSSVAIGVTLATIYHELAQELADYFLLTEHCGIPPVKALVLNFLCGLSVMFGVILILALDVSNMATGCILAVSAGVYIHIAASECVPRIEKELKTLKDRAISILCFVLGAVPIGLVLLNHGHCTG